MTDAIIRVPTYQPDMLGTVYDDQDTLLETVMSLYCPWGFDLDATYGSGVFYKSGRIPAPAMMFDINPRKAGVVQADCRDLPLENQSVFSSIFDPPFMHATGEDSVLGVRFSSYPTQRDLQDMYWDSLCEYHRVLWPNGIMTFKCQDTIESGKEVWTHIIVFQMALSVGFIAKDLMILVAQNRPQGYNHKKQYHARRFHSYFWTFQKTESSHTCDSEFLAIEDPEVMMERMAIEHYAKK